MDVNIRITNIPQIRRAFRAAPGLMKKNLSSALNRAALRVGRRAAFNAPVDTGRLRASIQGGSYQGGSWPRNTGLTFASPSNLRAIVEPQAEYAIYVHEGTRRMAARPFLREAAETEKDEIQREAEDAVQKTLNRVGRMT